MNPTNLKSSAWQQFLKSLKKREVAREPKKLEKKVGLQPEALEGRIAPAAVLDILAGENTTITGDLLDLFATTTTVFNVNANFTGFYNSGGLITLEVLGLDVFLISPFELHVRKTAIDGGTLTMTGGGGADDILFNPGLQSFGGLSASFDTVQTLPALTIGGGGLFIEATAGGVVVGGDISKTSGGAATVDLRARDNIVINSGSDVISTTGAMNVILNADRDASGSGGVFINSGGTTITTLGGDFTIGGGTSPTTTAVFGPTDKGIYVDGVTISAGAGNISIRGQGDATNGGGASIGVDLTNGTTITTTTGAITILGNSGTVSDNFSMGVSIFNGSSVSTADGIILVGGTSTATGTNAYGVKIQSNSKIEATANGNVTLTGTGSSAGSGSSNEGVALFDNADVLSDGTGVMVLDGVGGAGSHGIITGSGANDITIGGGAATGTITFRADSMSFGNTTVQTTNTATVRQLTNGVGIDLGSTGGVGATLNLSDAELDLFTAGTVQIGDSNSGAVTLSAAIAHATSSNFGLTSGGSIIFSTGSLNTGGGMLTLTPGAAGSVQATTSGVDVTTSAATALAFGSGADLAISITGATVDTQYTQLNLAGLVNLTGVDLVLSGGYVPTSGDSFIIVNNDAADAVTGTFNGLAEGATVTINGVQKKLTYIGGTGNDVALVPLGTTDVGLSAGNLAITDADGGNTNDTLTITLNGANVRINDPLNLLAAGAGATQIDANTVEIPLANITAGITIDTLGGDDVFTVDFTGGNVIPGSGLTFAGGAGGNDSIIITGGTTGTVTHSFTNANDGSITLAGSLTGVINYTGLEPITDNLSATDRVFTFTGGTESISLVDSVGPTMTIDSTLAELVIFLNPTNSLTINATSGTDTVTITSMDAAYAGSLTITSDGGDTATISAGLPTLSLVSVTADTINLNSLTTTGAQSYTGAVTLPTDTTLTTTNSNVSFSTTVNADAAASNRTLSIAAGTGAVSFGGAVGGLQALQSLTVGSAASASLGAVTTRSGGLSVTASAITLMGNIATDNGGTAGAVSFTGPVTLGANVAFDTDGSTDASVSFSTTVNSDATARTLQITSGGGDVTFSGVVGGTNALKGLTIVSSNNANLGNVTTESGGIAVTSSNNVNLSGGLVTTTGGTAGAVSITGPTRLTGNVSINTNATTTDAGITITGAVNADAAGNNRTLTLDAGTGAISATSNVGATTNLGTYTITSAASASIGRIDTRSGGVSVTATAITLGGNISTDGLTAAGPATFTGAVTLGAGVTIDTDNTGTDGAISFSSTINGARSLVLTSGSGNTTLSGAVGGTTPLTGLTVTAGDFSATSIALAASSALSITNTGTASTITGAITGTGATLAKAGAGTLIIDYSASGAPAGQYSGGTTVTGGTLALKDNTFGGIGRNNNLSFIGSGALVVTGATVRAETWNPFSFTTPVAVTLNSGAVLTMLDGQTAHIGALTLNGGTLASTANPSTQHGSWALDQTITVSAGTSTISASKLAWAGTRTFDVTGTLDLTGTIAPGTSVPSGYAVTKAGSGTMNLAGANTYTGATAVNAGTLRVNGSVTSNVTVTSPGTFGGSGTVTGNVSGNGTVAPGNSPGILTISGNFTPTGTVAFEVNQPYNTAGTDYDQIVVGGTVDLSGATLSITGGTAAASALQTLTLINKTSGGATVASASPAEGATVTLGSGSFKIFYNGGDGNNVVLVDASTPTVVYAEDTAWSGFTNGTFIADADFGTAGNQPAVFGVNAFTTIGAGITAVTASGQIIVNDGLYSEAVSLNGTKTLTVTTGAAVTLNSFTSIAGTTTAINGTSLTVGDATSTTAAGLITGAGALTKQGAGRLTLSNPANTFSGNVSVQGGFLQASAGHNDTNNTSAFGLPVSAGRTITVGSGATLEFAANDTFGNAGASPTVSIIANGGTITNTGNFFNTLGPVTLNAATLNAVGGAAGTFQAWRLFGTVTVGGAAASTISGSGANSGIHLHSSTTFDVADATGNANPDLIISGVLINQTGAQGSAAGALVKNGVGTIAMTGANTFSGGSTLNAGTLQIGTGSTTGTPGAGSITLSGGTLALNRSDAPTFNNPVSLTAGGNRFINVFPGTTATLSGAFSGGGELWKDGTGTLVLSNAANAHTNSNVINAGVLEIADFAALGGGNLFIGAGGSGTIKYTGTTATTTKIGAFALQGTGKNSTIEVTNAATTLTLSAAVGNSGAGKGFTKIGNGTLLLSGANTFDGGIAFNGGVVSTTSDGNLGATPGAFSASHLSFDGGTLKLATAYDPNPNRGITINAGGATIDASGYVSHATVTLNQVIAGTGPLTLRSTGDVSATGGGNGALGIDLRATNTFTGAVTITSGLVAYTADAAFGNAANTITLNGGGLLDPNRNITIAHNVIIGAGGGTIRTYGSTTATFSGSMSGAGSVNRTDGGTLVLSGALSSFSGTFNDQAGNTTISGAGVIGGNWALSAGTTLTVTSASAQSIAGTISGAGAVTKDGAGTLTLSGANSYAGATAINAGTVLLGNATALGTTAGATTIVSGATLDLNGLTIAENITSAGTGVGALGAIINSNAAAATVTGTITNSGSTVGVAAGNITFSGSVNGNTLTKIGTGTLFLSGTTDNNSLLLNAQAGTVVLDKTVTGTSRSVAGITDIATGATVRISTAAHGDQIFGGSGGGAISLVNMSGGTLDLNGKSESFSRLTGTGTVTSGVAGAATLTVGEANGTGATFTGAIQNGTGTVSLTKIGTGTQTLGGASNYSGGTTISAGTLIGDNNTAFGIGTITLNDASTLANNTSVLLANSVDITNAVTVANLGTGVSTIGTSGAGAGANATTFSGTITLNKATTFSGTATDRLAIDGQVTGSVGTLTVSGGSRTTLQSTANNFVGNILITGAGTTLQASVATAGEVIPNATNVDVGASTTFMLAGSAGATETINALTGSGTVTRNVGGTQTLTVGSAGGGGAFTGTMNNGSGTVALTKIGAGTQTLSGTGINFGGATTVSNGRLILSEATSHGNGASTTSFSVAAGATLEFNVAGTHRIGSTSGADGILISGGGTLQKTGVGLLALDEQGSNLFKVTMAMTTGALIDVQGGAIRNGGWQGQVWTNNKADLNIAGGATFDIWDGNGVIVDALTGAGTLNRGIGGTSTIIVGIDNGSGTFTGTITDSAGGVALTKSGTGNQTLSGPNAYSGATTINAGTLTLGSATALGTTAGATTIVSGATLDLNGQTIAENITSAGTGVGALGAIINSNAAAATVTGTISNSGSTVGVAAGNITFSGSVNLNTLTKIGTGTLTLSGTTDNNSLLLNVQAGTVVLDKTVTGTSRSVAGITDIATGATVRISTAAHGDQIFGGSVSGPNSLVNISAGGTLDLNGKSESFSRLTGGGTVTSGVAGAVTLTLGEANGTGAVFAGLILNGSGTMSLTKIGTGTQTISGTGSSTNTASGLLQVSGGTLIMGAGFGGDGGWQGDVTINTASTLQLAQGNIFNNGSDWTINTGGTFNMNGQSDAIGNIAGGGAITNNNGGLFLDDISGTKTFTGTINGTNALTLRGNVASSGTQELKPLTATTSTLSNLVVQRGTLLLGGAGTITASGNLSVGQIGATGGNLTIQDTVTVGVGAEFLIGDASSIPGFVTQTGGTVNVANRVRLGHWSSPTTSTYAMSGGSLNVTNTLNVGWDGSATFTQTGGTVSATTVAIDGSGATATAVETYTLQGGTLNVGTGGIVSADGPAGYSFALGGGTAPVLRATGNFTSTLNAVLSGVGANAVTIDTNGFTVGLGGVMSGTGDLIKVGANVLTLSGANTFSGATAVNVGTLTAGNGAALGTTAGTTTVASGATLNINGQNLGAEIVNIAGTGVGGLGALVNNGADQTQALRFINLTADATVGGTNRFDIRTNGGGEQLDLAGFTLTKVGANQFSIVGTNVTNGNLTANAGTLAIETSSTVAGSGTITINAATLALFANTGTFTRPIVLNSGATINEPGSGGTATVSSPITLNANVAINSGTNTTVVLNGVITDGAGTFGYSKGGAGTLVLAGANTYDGTTTVSAGTLQIGNSGTSGSVGTGPVINNSNLHFKRTDATSFGNTVTGTGTTRQLDGSGQVTITGSVTQGNVYAGSGSTAIIAAANPLVLSGTSVLNVSGIFGGTTNEAGMGLFGKAVIQTGATLNTANLWLGEQTGRTGEIQQDGGAVTVSQQMRVAHWPSNTSTYTINGGTLALTGTPAGGAEQNGILYVGIDGTGIFNQTGGTVTAAGMVLDNRGDTAGTDTYTMTGGTLVLGSFGISGNASTQVNLQGGTVRASASFTAALPVTFTGGSTTVDTNGFDITLSNTLSGSGNFNKINGGTLNISGSSAAYAGTGSMAAGTTHVTGTLGSSSTFAVNGGTLTGTGTLAGTVNVNTGGTVNPGTVATVGTLTVGTLSFNGGTYAANLIGTAADKISVTGSANLNAGTAGIFSLTNAASGVVASTVFNFIEVAGVTAITGVPLTNAAQGSTTTVDGQNATYSYLGGVGGNDFTLTVDGPLVVTGTAADDTFEVRRVIIGADDVVQTLLGGIIIDSRPAGTVGTVTVNGTDGNDTMFINYGASGGVHNFNTVFNGGNQTIGDSLSIGGASVTTVTHNFVNNNDGSIVVVNGAGTRTVTYTGLEPIVDNLNAVNRVFTFSGATETISLTDAGGGNSTIDSNVGGETVTFLNPTATLTVNGGAGDDTINITSTTFAGAITVNDDADADVINISAGLPTFTSAAFTAETINAATLTTSGNQTYTGAVLLSGATTLTSNTGGITITGTANGAQALSLSAVAGNINVTGAIGGVTPLTSLTTLSATISALPAITAGALSITATAGGVSGANNVIISGATSVTAAGAITLNGAGNDFQGSVTLSATAAGAIAVTDSTGGLNVASATTTDGAISLTATSGNLTATSATAGGAGRNVTLTTVTSGNVLVGSVTAAGDTITINSAGAIEESGADLGADLTASTLSLTAASGIGAAGIIETAANTINGTTVTGGIALANSGALNVTGLSATTSGDISLTNTGGLTTSGVVSAAGGTVTLSDSNFVTLGANVSGSGDVLITAGEISDSPTFANDVTLNATFSVTSTAGSVTLRAGDDIVTNAGSLISAATTATLTAAFGDLDSSGAIQHGGAITAVGNVTGTARTNIALGGNITSTGADVSLTSTNGNITRSAGTVAGGTVTLSATTGTIGASGAAVNTNATSLIIASSGNQFVTEANGANVTSTATAGNITLVSTTGDWTVNATGVDASGTVTITASAGDILRSGVAADITGTTLTLTAGGADGDIGASGNELLTTGTQISFFGAGSGDVFITESNGASVTGSTGSGAISLVTTLGDWNVNTTGLQTTGNVSLTALDGDIQRTGPFAIITGNTLTFTAGGADGDIGIGGTTPLIVSGTSIVFAGSGTGDVSITESNGASVTGSTGSGNITLVSNTGNWTVVSTGVSTTGNVTMTATAGDLLRQSGVATAVVAGNNVTLTAGGANGDIGASALPADRFRTDATNLVFTGTGTGNVSITELTGATVTGSTGSGSINLTTVGGDWTVVSSGLTTTGNQNITALGGDILRSGAGALISGAALTLFAGGADGDIGSSASPLLTTVASIGFTGAGTGEVFITETNGATVSGTTGSGDINLVSTSGDWTITGDVTTTGNVTITAGDDILTTGGTVSGNVLTFTASGIDGVNPVDGDIGEAATPILTSGSTIVFAGAGLGEVAITEADGATVSGTTGSGVINLLSTTGDWTIDGNITTTGNVNITASAGSILRTAGTVSGNLLTLTASGANGTVGNLAAPIFTSATTISFTGNGTGEAAITESNGASVSGTTGSGDINLLSTAGTWTLIGNVATTGNVTISAGADILRTAGTVSGNVLTFTAGGADGDIGATGAAIQTIGTAIVFAGSGTGDVVISESNGATVTGSTGTGNVTLTTATGDWTVVNTGVGTAGNVLMTALDGDLVRIGLGAVVAGNVLTLTAGGADGGIGSPLTDFLTSGATINFTATGTGNVNLSEQNDAIVGGVTGAGNTQVNLSASGNWNVNVLALSAASTVANIIAGASVLDNNGATNNLTALAAIIVGGSGIGTAGDLIETDIANLEADGGNGDVYIAEANALTIGGISAMDGVSTLTGDVRITSGSLSIIETIDTPGSVTLNSTGTITESGAGVISAGDLVTSSVGAQTLNGDNEVGSFTATNTGAGTGITLQNTFDAFEILAVTNQTGGNVVINNDGIDANINGVISSGTPALGGDINVQTDGLLSVNAQVNSQGGAGGTLTLGGLLTLNASPVVGFGDVTLQGGAGPLTINAPITVSSPIVLQSTEDVNILAKVETTSLLSDITVLADLDFNGTGGVYIGDNVFNGSLKAGRNLDVRGSEYLGSFVPALANLDNSIIIDSNGSAARLEAVGNVFLKTNNSAPVTSQIWLGGLIRSNTSGDVSFDSSVLVTHDDARVLTHGAGDVIFQSTIDSEATDNFDLRISTDVGIVLFNAAVGQVNPLGDVIVDTAFDVTIVAPFDAGSFTAGNILGTVDFGGPVTLTADGLNLNVNALTMLIGAPLNFTATGTTGDAILQVDNIDIADTVAGNGVLTIQPQDITRSIGLNAAGSLNLTTAEIDQLQDGFSRIIIGRSTGTGLITVGERAGLNSWLDPVTFRSPGAGGQIDLIGQIAGTTADGGFTFLAPKTVVNVAGSPTISTTGGDVLFGTFSQPNAIALLTDLSIETVGGDVISYGTINGAFDLSVDADAGAVTLWGSPTAVLSGTSIGGTSPLSSITVSGGIVTLRPNITTTGTQNYTGTQIRILDGTRVSTAGDLVFNGSTVIEKAVNNRAAGSIVFNGDVDSGAAGLGALGLYATDVTFTGAVGSAVPLLYITVDVGGTLSVDDSLAAATLSIKANEVDFGGGANSVFVTGTLAIEVASASTALRIGGVEALLVDGAPTLNFSDDDVAALADGATSIIFGRLLGSLPIVVAETGSVTFKDAVTFRQTQPGGGQIRILGDLIGDTANGSITTKSTTLLDGSVTTLGGGNIDILTGLIAGNTTLDSSAGGGDIFLRGNWAATAAGAGSSLTVSAGTGDITMSGDIGLPSGRSPALGAVTLDSDGIVVFGRTLTAASLAVNGTGIAKLGGTILTSGAAGQTYQGAVEIAKATNLTSKHASGLIEFQSTVDSIATKFNTLSVTNRAAAVGTTVVRFDAEVGGTQRLGTFRVNTSGVAEMNDSIYAKAVSIRAAEFTVNDVDTYLPLDSVSNGQIYSGTGNFLGAITSERLSITTTADVTNVEEWRISGIATINTSKTRDITLLNVGATNNRFDHLIARGRNVEIQAEGNINIRGLRAEVLASITALDVLGLGGNITQTGGITAANFTATAFASINLDNLRNRISQFTDVTATNGALTLRSGSGNSVVLEGTMTAGGGNMILAATGGSFTYTGTTDPVLVTPGTWTIYTALNSVAPGINLATFFGADALEMGNYPTVPVAVGNVVVFRFVS